MGLIFAETLTGVRAVEPMTGQIDYICILAHASGNIKIPGVLLDSPLGDIVRKATALHPKDRYADAAAFAQALRAFQTRLSGDAMRHVFAAQPPTSLAYIDSAQLILPAEAPDTLNQTRPQPLPPTIDTHILPLQPQPSPPPPPTAHAKGRTLLIVVVILMSAALFVALGVVLGGTIQDQAADNAAKARAAPPTHAPAAPATRTAPPTPAPADAAPPARDDNTLNIAPEEVEPVLTAPPRDDAPPDIAPNTPARSDDTPPAAPAHPQTQDDTAPNTPARPPAPAPQPSAAPSTPPAHSKTPPKPKPKSLMPIKPKPKLLMGGGTAP